jgi:hypothetical protein
MRRGGKEGNSNLELPTESLTHLTDVGLSLHKVDGVADGEQTRFQKKRGVFRPHEYYLNSK